MKLQVLQDGFGNNTGVFIPMNDWKIITQKHLDLKELITIPKTKKKISELAGLLSSDTADAMIKEVEESRKSWEERLKKQF
jgi:hypothetical protein